MAITRKNEILGKAVEADPEIIPRYKLVKDDGTVVAEHVELQLENPILQEGMSYDRDFANEILTASGTTAGTAEALTLAQENFVLFEGATARIKLHVAISGATTLNVHGSGAFALVTADGSVDVPTLSDSTILTLVYNGGQWVIQGIQFNSARTKSFQAINVLAPDTSPLTWPGVNSPVSGLSYPIVIDSTVSPISVTLIGLLGFHATQESAALVMVGMNGRVVKRHWNGTAWTAWSYGAEGDANGKASSATAADNATKWAGMTRVWQDVGLQTYLMGSQDNVNCRLTRADYFMYRAGGTFTGNVAAYGGQRQTGMRNIACYNSGWGGVNTIEIRTLRK